LSIRDLIEPRNFICVAAVSADFAKFAAEFCQIFRGKLWALIIRCRWWNKRRQRRRRKDERGDAGDEDKKKRSWEDDEDAIEHRCTTLLGQGPHCIIFNALEGRRQNN